jgi:ribosomal protein L7/L12
MVLDYLTDIPPIMALIKCPECSNEVSDKAAACPKCGYPIKSGSTAQPIELEPLVRETLLREGKIAAIKVYRERTGAQLIDSKQYVERIEQTLPPGTVQKSGCIGVLVLGGMLVLVTIIYFGLYFS